MARQVISLNGVWDVVFDEREKLKPDCFKKRVKRFRVFKAHDEIPFSDCLIFIGAKGRILFNQLKIDDAVAGVESADLLSFELDGLFEGLVREGRKGKTADNDFRS